MGSVKFPATKGQVGYTALYWLYQHCRNISTNQVQFTRLQQYAIVIITFLVY